MAFGHETKYKAADCDQTASNRRGRRTGPPLVLLPPYPLLRNTSGITTIFYRPWTVDRGPWMLVRQHITPDAGSLLMSCVGCSRTAHRQWGKVGHDDHKCGYAAQEWGKVMVGISAQNTAINLQLIQSECLSVNLCRPTP